jgi:hypothetical protein
VRELVDRRWYAVGHVEERFQSLGVLEYLLEIELRVGYGYIEASSPLEKLSGWLPIRRSG